VSFYLHSFGVLERVFFCCSWNSHQFLKVIQKPKFSMKHAVKIVSGSLSRSLVWSIVLPTEHFVMPELWKKGFCVILAILEVSNENISLPLGFVQVLHRIWSQNDSQLTASFAEADAQIEQNLRCGISRVLNIFREFLNSRNEANFFVESRERWRFRRFEIQAAVIFNDERSRASHRWR
jgi:hypothetical protein